SLRYCLTGTGRVGGATHGVGRVIAELSSLAAQPLQAAARYTRRLLRALPPPGSDRCPTCIVGARGVAGVLVAAAPQPVLIGAHFRDCLTSAGRIGGAAHGVERVIAELSSVATQPLQTTTLYIRRRLLGFTLAKAGD